VSEQETIYLSEAHKALANEEVIIYPTEAVWGIGCDPTSEEAVRRLLELKRRPVEKGLILIAKDYSQLLPYINDAAIPMDKRAEIFSSWPGPFTWLMPASETAPRWITGGSDLIAVRVTAHPTVRRLCSEFNGAIVSTSANFTGQDTPDSLSELKQQFQNNVSCYVDEALGNASSPSTIRNAMTGETLRG
jgi:L-threonylcarbamoyladenylate synthase